MYDAFLYIVANEGIDTSASYPYSGKVFHMYTQCNHLSRSLQIKDVCLDLLLILHVLLKPLNEALYKGHFHNPSVSFLQRFRCTLCSSPATGV